MPQWPLVRAAAGGCGQLKTYLSRFASAVPAKAMRAAPGEHGRYFYRADMQGYNFAVEELSLGALLDELDAVSALAPPPGLYAGSMPTDEALPGFDAENALPFDPGPSRARIWLSNASHVSAHYDVSDNVAVVAMGRRRFTLFPPQQTPNMYVGPLDVTIAGQPVSMVDMRQPDLARFPRFAEAMAAAQTAVLEPGDAIFIPTLWWHQVIASDPVNVLVNYWFAAPEHSPFVAMLHGLLAVRDLPEAQREAWKVWFDHYVFGPHASEAAAHLPPHAMGVAGPPSPARSRALRDHIVQSLGGR